MARKVLVTDPQFGAAVKTLAAMSVPERAQEATRLNAKQARGYYVELPDGSRLSMKLAAKAAYDQAGVAWDRPQSRNVYDSFQHLTKTFRLVHEPGPTGQTFKQLVHEERLEREYVQRLNRKEQPAFRRALLEVNPRCLVSGCKTVQALEAAHVLPAADGGSYDLDNGVLLRADLHRLFDLCFLALNPRTGKVSLHTSCHGDYDVLLGFTLKVEQRKAWAKALDARWRVHERRRWHSEGK